MADDTFPPPPSTPDIGDGSVKAPPKPRARAAGKTAPEVGSTPKASPKGAKAAVADFTETTTQSLKDGAASLGKEASARARTLAEDGKARAGNVLDELSRLLGDAAGTVDEKVGQQYGQYARSAADAVANFSGQLKEKDLDALVADARDFVKKSPAVAIGTAAALGFVLVRLVRSGLDAHNADDA